MRLGHKNKFSLASRIGLKQVGSAGRLASKHSENIEGVAGSVESVANKVAGAAGTAASVAALTGFGAPVAGALAGISGSAATLGRGAGMVRSGAEKVNRIKSANRMIDRFLG